MDKLRSAYRVTVIIGLAMMASLLVYLIVVSLMENGTIVLRERSPMPAGTLEALKTGFLVLSALVFAVIRVVNRVLLKTGGERPAMRGERRQQGQPVAPDAGPLANAAVVTFAFCEVPAILGLVLYFLAGSVTDFYLFLIISLFAFSFHFPRFSQWEEWSRRPR